VLFLVASLPLEERIACAVQNNKKNGRKKDRFGGGKKWKREKERVREGKKPLKYSITKPTTKTSTAYSILWFLFWLACLLAAAAATRHTQERAFVLFWLMRFSACKKHQKPFKEIICLLTAPGNCQTEIRFTIEGFLMHKMTFEGTQKALLKLPSYLPVFSQQNKTH